MASVFRSIKDSMNPWHGATDKDCTVAAVAIEYLIKQITSDRFGPTKIVADGPFHWRKTFMAEFKSFRLVDEGIAMVLFKHFEALHEQRFPLQTPKQILDAMTERSLPTQKDVDKAWTIESASSPEGREHFYGTGNGPDDLLPQLVEQNPVTPPSQD